MTLEKNINQISNTDYEKLINKTLSTDKNKEKSIVEGKIISIDNDNVIIDVGLKSEGRVPMSEFVRPGQKEEVNIGDIVKVYIDRLEGKNGETKLSREKAVKQAAWNSLQDSFTSGKVVKGIPFNKVKGGLSVDLNGVVAFLPGSQIDSKLLINDTKELLNKEVDLLILKMDKYRGNIVVSRKAISDVEMQEKREKLLSNITEGSIIKGKVKNITDYGAFVDLGGIDGLVHVTDISWKKINHPSDKLTLGEEVEVKVLKYDEEITRLSLGIKQLTDDPWEKISDKYNVDTIYEVKVSNITDTGVLVSFKDDYDGFIQTQDISWLKKPPHPSKMVQIGDVLKVKLIEINTEKRRLYCGLKQLKENPWNLITTKFKVGESLETEIVNKVDFGIFVKIFEEIDGMVHVSDLNWNEKESEEILKSLKKGDKIKVKILGIDTEKERISLSVKHLEKDVVQEYIEKNPLNSIVSGKIIEIDDKGIMINLAEEVNGFIKKSNLSKDKAEQKVDRFAKEEVVDSKIISYDEKLRKIGLSIKDAEAEEEKKALSKFGSQDSGASLGDILSDVLKKKT